jgi:hypothetical protein
MNAPDTDERIDAAAERLKDERQETAPKPKRAKSPAYYVLAAETDEHEGLWVLLTPEPIAAPSRQAAISQAIAERGDPTPLAADMPPERFVVIRADDWWTKTRGLKPRAGFEEVWS